MRRSLLLPSLCAALWLPATAAAQDGFDLGLRMNIVTGNGEPTNDILSYGLFGRWPLNDRWRVGVAVDHSPEFDVERAAKLVGEEQALTVETIDAKGTSNFLRAWVERVYPSPGGRREWFWQVGAGTGEVDVEDAIGPRRGGGTFHVVTDAGTELVAGAGAGLRWFFTPSWAFEIALRADRHFADWTLEERVTGATATVDDYLVKGGHLALNYRF